MDPAERPRAHEACPRPVPCLAPAQASPELAASPPLALLLTCRGSGSSPRPGLSRGNDFRGHLTEITELLIMTVGSGHRVSPVHF